MLRAARVGCLVALCVLSGCKSGGAFYFMPPGRLSLGGGTLVSADSVSMVNDLSYGAHLASALKDEDLPGDAGLGYGGTLSPANGRLHGHGPYLEASGFLVRETEWRLGLGGRSQLLFGDGSSQDNHAGYSGMGRLSLETFTDHFDHGRHGVVAGFWGVGLFAESGFVHLPSGQNAGVAWAGMQLRNPFAFAATR